MLWPLSLLWPILYQWNLFAAQPNTAEKPLSGSQNTTVILGGGVIGLSTAYYMIKDQTALPGPVPKIVVLDSASELFAGASGGSTGILGDYGFKPEAAELGKLSWQLLKNLNQEFDGRSNWNWSEIVVRSVSFSEDAPPGYGKVLERPIPRWFKNSSDYHYHWISGPDRGARIDGLMFCQWLRKQLESMGVEIITKAIPQGLSINSQLEPQTFNINYKNGPAVHALEFNNLVIASGPWSQRVLATLFPASEISIPFDLAHAAGNHLLVGSPNWKTEDDADGCDQLYLGEILSRPLDISSYLGGTLYIGGYEGTTEDLPDFADDVQAQPAAVAAMKELCARTLDLAEDEPVQVFAAGRCYRPLVEMRRPVITELALERLMGPHKVPSNIRAGFYLNTGHGYDGITLGPGSGKIMSDIIYGRKPAADVSGLGLAP